MPGAKTFTWKVTVAAPIPGQQSDSSVHRIFRTPFSSFQGIMLAGADGARSSHHGRIAPAPAGMPGGNPTAGIGEFTGDTSPEVAPAITTPLLLMRTLPSAVRAAHPREDS